MPASYRRRTGFANRPLALRRAVLAVLGQRDRLTAWELASCLYCHGRPMVRPGWRLPTGAQVVSTRRALRRLIAKGRVEVAHHKRRWRVFQLVEKTR